MTSRASLAITFDAGIDVGVRSFDVELLGVIPNADGTSGVDGKPGQIRFTGHGAPGVIVGATAGDTYLDLDSGTIYQLN